MSIEIADLGVATNGVVRPSDATYLRSLASTVQDAINSPTIGACGQPAGVQDHDALCHQRLVLVVLDWLSQDDYSSRGDIRARSKPAIERLQRALGVRADGDWGPRTNAALEKLLKKQLGAGASARGTLRGGGKPKAPRVAKKGVKESELPPVVTEKPGMPKLALAGIGILGIGALALFLGRRKGLGEVDLNCPCVKGVLDGLGDTVAVMRTSTGGRYAVIVWAPRSKSSEVYRTASEARRKARYLAKQLGYQLIDLIR